MFPVQQCFLGYKKSELVGQSILMLAGPCSDPQLLMTMISNSNEIKPNFAQLVLHDRGGMSRSFMVSCESVDSKTCLLSFKVSEALTLQESFEDVDEPISLVSAQDPFLVNMTNEIFASEFGCFSNEVLGLPISFVLRTESSFRWKEMLQRAACGEKACKLQELRSSGGSFSEYPGQETVMQWYVSCIPVVDGPNGKVSYVLLRFSNPTVSTLPDPADYNDQTWQSDVLNANRLEDPARLQRPAAAAAPSFASVICSDPAPRFNAPLPTDGPAPAIGFHGKPAGGVDEPSGPGLPVLLTSDTLAALRGLPLPQAARAVGLSATAFKRACRRLGVRRWDYKRGPGRRNCGGCARPSAAKIWRGHCCAPDLRPPAAASEGSGPRPEEDPPGFSLPCPPRAAPPSEARRPGSQGPAAPCAHAAAASASGARRPRADGDLDWLEPGPFDPAPVDDALVLDMLAQPWPLWA